MDKREREPPQPNARTDRDRVVTADLPCRDRQQRRDDRRADPHLRPATLPLAGEAQHGPYGQRPAAEEPQELSQSAKDRLLR